MKLNWIIFLCLAMFVAKGNAEQSLTIDNQTISNQPANTISTEAPTPAGLKQQAAPDNSEVNRERALKGNRNSPLEKSFLARAAQNDNNKLESAKFIKTYKARLGVTSLPSGVMYKVIRAGKGRMPTDASKVMCRFRGTLANGTQFDSTDKTRPVLTNVAGLLPGLKEVVTHMPVGSKWEIVIPPELGYGTKGNRSVGPNAVLRYQMEIVSIK